MVIFSAIIAASGQGSPMAMLVCVCVCVCKRDNGALSRGGSVGSVYVWVSAKQADKACFIVHRCVGEK